VMANIAHDDKAPIGCPTAYLMTEDFLYPDHFGNA
jgi:hypothetical protein